MITRRSFLKFLGFLPAAPVVAKLPVAEARPVLDIPAIVTGASSQTVFGSPSNAVRALYAKELAEAMRNKMDEVMFKVLRGEK